MSVSLTLTDEQARWLRDLLRKRAEDASWSDTARADPHRDDSLHTEAVERALDKLITKGSWT